MHYSLLTVLVLTLACSEAFSQRGKVIRPASTSVMDPNNDGFVSKTTAGFSNDGYNVDEFELKMFGIPKIGGDVTGDNIGQNCGITDLIPDNKGSSVYAVRDASNNLIFRFRVGDDNPSVEAWTILLDTDGKIGTNDPNATPGNPGFEIDITLIKRNNSGVLVYNLDGVDNCPSPLLFYSIDSHFQISIADEVSCGDPDYFYDFYVPFAEIASAFGINVNTGLRYVALTNVSATCAMGGNISDISGVDNNDPEYSGCETCAFEDLVNNQCPTAIADLCETCPGFEKDKVSKPGIDVPIRAGQTLLTGTTVESNIFIRLQVFTNTAPEGSTPTWGTVPREEVGVYSVGNIWTVNLSNPLLAYDKIVAIAQKDEFSVPCNAGGGDNSSSTSVTVVAPNTPPVALNQTINVAEDSQVSFALTATDEENDPLVYTIVTLPTKGTVSGSPPNITYTPNLNYSGPDSFTFQVSDGIFDSDVAGTITINVTPINDKPVANNQNVTTPEDTPAPITLTASDVDGDVLTYTIIASPSHGTLTGTLPAVTYTPDANYFGQDSFTFKVNDGQEDSNTATVSITVTPVGGDTPVANNQSVTTPEDTPVAIILTGSDPDLDQLTFVIVTAPAHGTLSGAAPNVTYTPVANYAGADSFTFRVNDGTLNSPNATVSITVTPVDDNPVANNQSVTTPEDTPVLFALSVSNPDNDPLTYTIVSAPSHGVLSGTAPNLTYTPNADYYGQDSFTFRVNNGSVDSNTATVSITVTPTGGDSPVAQAQSLTTPEDTPLAITLTGTDPDSDPLTYSIVTGPANGTLTGAAPNVTYRPNANFSGSDSFTFRVNDGTFNSAPATVTITVTAVNDAPVAFNQNVTFDMDTPRGIVLTGSDADGDVITYTITQQPANGTLSGTAPNVTYTPNTGFTGNDSFKFKVNDGTVDSNEGIVSLNLTPLSNVAPVANDQGVVTVEDTPVDIVLTSTDENGDNLTFTITQSPVNGTLNVSGAFATYTPASNFSGADSFKFETSDGTLTSNEATVSITVSPVNDAPVANSQSVTTVEDTPVLINLTGSDAEGAPLTFEIVTGPAKGTYSLAGASLTYTPSLNYNGTDNFTFRVNDGTTNSSAASVTITVTPVSDAPVAQDQVINTTEDTPADITLTATNAENALVFTITQSPSNGTLSGTGANVTYTPGPDFTGADSFKFEANDGALTSNEGTIGITVTPVNDAPVANSQSVTTLKNVAKDIILTGSDAEGSPLTYSIAGQPSNGTVTLNGTTATYTPSLNYKGADSFTFSVNDGAINSLPATISIQVNSVGSPPVAIDLTNVNTNEDTPTDVDLSSLVSDPDGDVINYTIVQQPEHGTISVSGGIATYTPDTNYYGPDTFIFVGNDGTSDSNPGTVNVTVLLINDPPVANDLEIATAEDSDVSFLLTASDVDGDYFSFSVLASPANGTLSGTAPDLTYSPDDNFFGTDSFTFRVNDGFSNSNTATVTITVTPLNDAPSITALTGLPQTKEDSTLRVCLDIVDVDGDNIMFGDPSNVKGGGTMVRDAAPFDFCYILTLPPNYNGESVWQMMVTDVEGLPGTTDATIIVLPVNDLPAATNDYASVQANNVLAVNVLSNDVPIISPYQEFYDIYEADSSDFLTVTEIISGPSHGSVTIGADLATLEYKPESFTFIGEDSIRYRVCDSGKPALCATAAMFIVVTDNDFAFNIYEGVSPNNDGQNDYFHIEGIHRFRKNLVRIFDRYNNLVWEMSDYDNETRRWDGQSNRGLSRARLPDGTYYYSILLEENQELFSGYVILKEN